jgi:hypothetical protein
MPPPENVSQLKSIMRHILQDEDSDDELRAKIAAAVAAPQARSVPTQSGEAELEMEMMRRTNDVLEHARVTTEQALGQLHDVQRRKEELEAEIMSLRDSRMHGHGEPGYHVGTVRQPLSYASSGAALAQYV